MLDGCLYVTSWSVVVMSIGSCDHNVDHTCRSHLILLVVSHRGLVFHFSLIIFSSTQVVVELSRNQTCDHIVIVGQREFAIKRLYDTLCRQSQWTALTESIVDNLSLSVNGNRGDSAHFLDMASENPLRVKDLNVPNSNSGFVYLLISTMDTSRVYVGQTANLAVRLNQHNSGSGAEGTAFIRYLPWCVGAYLSGMGHLTRSDRMALEYRWKKRNQTSVRNGYGTIEQFIDNGHVVMDEYNEAVPKCHPEYKIHMVTTVERQYASELFVYEDNEGELDGGSESGEEDVAPELLECESEESDEVM